MKMKGEIDSIRMSMDLFMLWNDERLSSSGRVPAMCPTEGPGHLVGFNFSGNIGETQQLQLHGRWLSSHGAGVQLRERGIQRPAAAGH